VCVCVCVRVCVCVCVCVYVCLCVCRIRYRDLLESADSIKEMDKIAIDSLGALETLLTTMTGLRNRDEHKLKLASTSKGDYNIHFLLFDCMFLFLKQCMVSRFCKHG